MGLFLTKDWHEDKARELCRLDGMDADEIVDGAPRWKQYRLLAKCLNYALSFGARNCGRAIDGTG